MQFNKYIIYLKKTIC